MTICAHLLSIKDVVVTPEFTDAEALVKPTIFVGLCEKPRCIHEILAFGHDVIVYLLQSLQNKSP
jgi:hypothetical protein